MMPHAGRLLPACRRHNDRERQLRITEDIVISRTGVCLLHDDVFFSLGGLVFWPGSCGRSSFHSLAARVSMPPINSRLNLSTDRQRDHGDAALDHGLRVSDMESISSGGQPCSKGFRCAAIKASPLQQRLWDRPDGTIHGSGSGGLRGSGQNGLLQADR